MSDDFFAFVDAFDDDQEALLFIDGARWSEGALVLSVRVHELGASNPNSFWTLACTGVREHELVLGPCDVPWELSDDHVLLWPYTKPVATLHFNGRPADIAAAVGKLYDAHSRIVSTWHHFGRWFNQLVPIDKLLACGYGFLANGPEPLIRGYQEVLTAMQIPSSILSNTPKHWNGQHWEDETGLKVALILGKTYVVADRVESSKADH